MASVALTAVLYTVPSLARPNIVLFMPDDMPFYWSEAPSQTNHPGTLTPNMDAIRAAGVTFTQAYTAGVMCAPARFAVLTGRYCSRSEYARSRGTAGTDARVGVSVPNCKITGADRTTTVAAALSAVGYRTIFSGKWHLSQGRTADLFGDYAGVWADVQASGFTVDAGIYATNMGDPDALGFSHNLEWNVELSRTAIREAHAAGDNFFLYFAPTMPHGPSVLGSLTMTDGILKTPKEALSTPPASGMMSRADIVSTYGSLPSKQLGTVVSDLALGAVLAELDANAGLAANTLVVCLMDHGVLDKPEITEGGIRIAMMARYPGVIPATTRITSQVTNLDLAATFFEVAEVASAPYTTDGTSWLTAASGGADLPARYTLSEDGQDRAVVSPTGHKLVLKENPTSAALYDLGLDPTEGTNRINDVDYVAALAELTAVLQCHDGNTGWTPGSDPQPNCHAASPSPAPPAPPTASPTPAPAAALLCCRDGSPASTGMGGRCSHSSLRGRPSAAYCP